MGIIVMLIGFLVMASPLVAGISVALMVGIMLAISGLAQLVFAFKSGNGLFSIILGALTVIIGGYMISNLNVALATLTFFVAAYLIASGIFEALMSFQARPAYAPHLRPCRRTTRDLIAQSIKISPSSR